MIQITKLLKFFALLSKSVQANPLGYFPFAVTAFNLDLSINMTSKNRNVWILPSIDESSVGLTKSHSTNSRSLNYYCMNYLNKEQAVIYIKKIVN